jgi:hypothetical protein
MPITDIDAQRQELMQKYDGLNSLEQAIVQLFAVIYQSINKTQLVVCLSKSGIRDAAGKVFVPKTLNPLLLRLTEQHIIETIDTRYRCHPLLMEIVTRQAVQQSNFESMAQAIQEADPLHDRRYYFYASPFVSYEQAVREIRLALYRGDFKKMYQQLDASATGYPQQFAQYNPLLLIFGNPFDKAWLLSLPGKLLDSILTCMPRSS